MKYLIFFLLLGICFVSADSIYFKKGLVRNEVQVVEENYQKVMYTEQGRPNPLPASAENVEWIEYSDAPREFSDGRNALNLGDYEGAVAFFRDALEVAQRTQIRPWLQPYTFFHLGRAYQKWGDSGSLDPEKYETAISYYQKTWESQANTRFLFACYLYFAQCQLQLKNFAAVREKLEKLADLSDKEKNATWQFQALLWQGHLDLAQKSYASALSKYREAENLTTKDGDNLKDEARLAIGQCYVAQNDLAAAKRHFEKMLGDATSKNWELLLGAQNGLAICYLEEGNLTQARRLVIEGVVKYPGAVTQQARAFFIAAECYEKLAAKEAGARARARAYYQLLCAGHSDSEWGRKAARKLQQLKEKEK
jgi:tetratricopeptide (TPR) repeat protein